MADSDQHICRPSPVTFEPFKASLAIDRAETAWAQAYNFQACAIVVGDDGVERVGLGLSSIGDALGLLFVCSPSDARLMSEMLTEIADSIEPPLNETS